MAQLELVLGKQKVHICVSLQLWFSTLSVMSHKDCNEVYILHTSHLTSHYNTIQFCSIAFESSACLCHGAMVPWCHGAFECMLVPRCLSHPLTQFPPPGSAALHCVLLTINIMTIINITIIIVNIIIVNTVIVNIVTHPQLVSLSVNCNQMTPLAPNSNLPLATLHTHHTLLLLPQPQIDKK